MSSTGGGVSTGALEFLGEPIINLFAGVDGFIPGREGGLILTTIMAKASRTTTKTRTSTRSTTGEERDNNNDNNYNGQNDDDGKDKDDDLNF